MQSFKVSQAARLLGVSDDTVRRWVDQGVLPVTDASPTEIPGDALARRAVELAAAAADPSDVLSSARNRFVGLVTRVQVDGVMAQVDLQAGPHRVVSLMSAEAVRDLALAPGSLAVAVVKATTVIVETPKDPS
jgi:molybdopterin-binding protein